MGDVMPETNSLNMNKRTSGVWNISLGDWDPSLETGMELVDSQHQAMFAQIRVLLDHSQTGRVPGTLEFMAVYAVEHFGMEERLHEETAYPFAEEHLDTHNRFIAAFKELRQEYDVSGHSLVILIKLASFLLDWWKEHIRNRDQQFADYFHRLRLPT